MLGYLATTTFTATLASLGSGSARESAAIIAMVGGTSYDDYSLQFTLGIQQATTALDKSIYVWFAGSADGTSFTSPAIGSDAAITIGTSHNLFGPFTVSIPTGAVTYNIFLPSVSQIFGGVIPKKFSLIFENQTNGTLSATEFTKYITPILFTT